MPRKEKNTYETCAKGHPLRGPTDTYGNGRCRECTHDHQAVYRTKRQAALELARALEANGIPVMRSTPLVDLQQLAAELSAAYLRGKPSTLNTP